MQVTPYLFFDGRCEEALAFYKKAIGIAPGMMMRFGESPEPPQPGMTIGKDKIMHAEFKLGDSTCGVQVSGIAGSAQTTAPPVKTPVKPATKTTAKSGPAKAKPAPAKPKPKAAPKPKGKENGKGKAK